MKPEWIRPRQVTELFGIGRGTVATLIQDGKIKSVSLCQDGLARGSRLISYASVCEFLDGLAAEQQNESRNDNDNDSPQATAQARMEEGGAA